MELYLSKMQEIEVNREAEKNHRSRFQFHQQNGIKLNLEKKEIKKRYLVNKNEFIFTLINLFYLQCI